MKAANYNYKKTKRLTYFLYIYIFTCFLSATEYKWNTTFRYRLKSDNTNINSPNLEQYLSEMRTRLTLDVLGKKASAHFTLQDSRVIGKETNLAGITGLTSGPAFHQIYFLFKWRRQLLRLGRFELPFGGERILSKNNWNNSGRSFEGLHIRRKNRLFQSHYFLLTTIESSYGNHENNIDERVLGAYLEFLMTKDGIFNSFELYHLNHQLVIDNSRENLFTTGYRGDLNITRLFSLESEIAFQYSESVSANMLCLNLKFEPIRNRYVKNIFLGADFISGNDTTKAKENGFAKTFGARHKYHGYYDFPSHKKFLSNVHDGLLDINLKTNTRFVKGSSLLVAYHIFNNLVKKKGFGQELDFLVKNKLSEELSLSSGFSLYFPNGEDTIKQFFYLVITANL